MGSSESDIKKSAKGATVKSILVASKVWKMLWMI